jgi:hypothetical protein
MLRHSYYPNDSEIFPLPRTVGQFRRIIMKHLSFTAAILAAAIASPVLAEGDLSRADVITVHMEMGSNDDGM